MARFARSHPCKLGLAAAVVAASLLASVVAASSVAAPAKQGAATFNVLAILPLSGPVAALGALQRDAAVAAATVVNREGGILGRKVRVTVLDDGGDGNKAATVLQSALAKGVKYSLIIPGSFDNEAIPAAAALKNNPTLQITPASGTWLTPKDYPALFSTTTGFQSNDSGLVTELKKHGVKSIGIIGGDDPTGHTGAAELRALAKAAGIATTATVFVPDTAADATAQLQQVQASSPQALAMTGFTPATGPILKARTKLGWTAPLYMDWFTAATNFGAIATPADLVGVTAQQVPYIVAGNPATKTAAFRVFWSELRKTQPHPIATISAPLTTWNAVMLARGAALKAKSIDGAALAKAMNGVTDASMVRDWIGSKKIYSATTHIPQAAPSDFIYLKPGPQVDGLMVPGK